MELRARLRVGRLFAQLIQVPDLLDLHVCILNHCITAPMVMTRESQLSIV